MEEEEILNQEEDDLEEEMRSIEEEEEEEKVKKPIRTKSKEAEPVAAETNETYEGFMQPERLGIVNTVSGDVIEGFKTNRDEGLVQLGKALLNKMDKIAIASGV